MSGRDLLYKPQVPIPLGDDEDTKKKVNKSPNAREIGSVGEVVKTRTDPSLEGKAKPAYKAAYFNQDISGVRQTNLRAKPAAALRGGEGASDLRKIVLPPAHGIDNPDPGVIRSAADLMALEPGSPVDLGSMLTRQGAMIRSPGVTVEMLEARLAQLIAMVESRKEALKRMRDGKSAERLVSHTILLARAAGGKALEKAGDVAEDGSQIIDDVRGLAEGMHKRLAKMLGIKR